MSRSKIEPAPVSSVVERTGLWRVFAHNVRDNVIAEVATQVVRIATMVILARSLDPNDFGVFRVLLVISVAVGLINQAGIPDALIQRPELRGEHECTAWWITIVLSLTSAGALYAAAPLIVRLMAMPALEPGIRLLCIPLIMEGAVVTAEARLQRKLCFGLIAVASIIAETAFLATALWCVREDYLTLSLPAALAARMAVHGLTIGVAAGRPSWGAPRWSAGRDLARFAGTAMSAQIVCFLSSNTDYLLIGRLLGGAALGYYSIAWDLLRFVPGRLHRVAGRVAFPTFCRLQNDDRGLGEAYLKFFGYIAKVVLPLVACVVVAAPQILIALYGSKWLPAAEPLRFLGVGLALAGLTVGTGSVYYAKNRPALDLYLHVARLVLLTIACVGFARFGLRGVSAAMGAEEAVIGLAGCWLVTRLIGARVNDLLRAATPGFQLGLACGVTTLVSKTAVAAMGVNNGVALALILLAPATVFFWWEATNMAEMMRNAFSAIPAAPSDSTVG